MVNISKEMKMLSNILKQYGNAKFITSRINPRYGKPYDNGQIIYNQGR